MGAVGILILISILNLIGGALLAEVGQSVSSLPQVAFGVVDYISDTIKIDLDGGLTKVFAGVGISLLLIKFVMKGFETYISYTDGDPDSDPMSLVILLCKAIAVLCGFNGIYNWIATITSKLTADGVSAVATATGTDFTTFCDVFKFAKDGSNILLGLFGIIFGILYFVVYFSIVKNAVEIFVLKVGLPIACVGLLNADKGIFKSYMMSFLKAFVTILVKVILTQLGFSITMVGATIQNGSDIFTSCFGVIVGICCLSLALTTPKLLSEFMIPSGGGGGFTSKAYYASNIISRIRK